MKKVLIGVIIGFVVIIGGCVAILGAGASSIDSAIKDVETQTVENDKKVEEMAKNIEWELKKDAYSTKIVGIFENTSDEKIDYIEFNYKLVAADKTVIENSFTNETDITPGEKRKVEILCMENDFDSYEITTKSSVF